MKNPILKCLFGLALLSPVVHADPALDSQEVVACLDSIRNQYFQTTSSVDSCGAETTSSGRLNCLRRNATPLPSYQTNILNGVAIDLPNSDANGACTSINDVNQRYACEREATKGSFPATEANICRSLPDGSQIMKCLMAVEGGRFDDRIATGFCATMTYNEQPQTQIVYTSPAPVIYTTPAPIIIERSYPVYYHRPIIVAPAPIVWYRPNPYPWRPHVWRHHL